ncbi:MAG TPA: hypothetical protein VK104_11015 [Burkholderiaceae bacterium]|nr:hypothetical protein [Burkholderiaceae bacterium]
MAFTKSSANQKYESGLSLLQGLSILGVIGIIAAIIFKYLAG